MQDGRECQGLAGRGMSVNSPQRALRPEDSPGKRVLSLHSGYLCSLVSGMARMQRQDPLLWYLSVPSEAAGLVRERDIRERGQVFFEAQLVQTWTIQTFLGLKGDSLRPGPPPHPLLGTR